MESVFDLPMTAVEFQESFWAGFSGQKTRHPMNDFHDMLASRHTISIEVRRRAPNAKYLADMRKFYVVVELSARPNLADFNTAMTFVGRLVLRGEKRCPGAYPRCPAEAWVDCL